jgi:hypothetical protein
VNRNRTDTSSTEKSSVEVTAKNKGVSRISVAFFYSCDRFRDSGRCPIGGHVIDGFPAESQEKCTGKAQDRQEAMYLMLECLGRATLQNQDMWWV